VLLKVLKVLVVPSLQVLQERRLVQRCQLHQESQSVRWVLLCLAIPSVPQRLNFQCFLAGLQLQALQQHPAVLQRPEVPDRHCYPAVQQCPGGLELPVLQLDPAALEPRSDPVVRFDLGIPVNQLDPVLRWGLLALLVQQVRRFLELLVLQALRYCQEDPRVQADQPRRNFQVHRPSQVRQLLQVNHSVPARRSVPSRQRVLTGPMFRRYPSHLFHPVHPVAPEVLRYPAVPQLRQHLTHQQRPERPKGRCYQRVLVPRVDRQFQLALEVLFLR